MKDWFPCPGCRGPIHASQDVCPSCSRPLVDEEREAGREIILRRVAWRRRLPWLGAAAAVLAGLAGAAYVKRELVLTKYAAARDEVRKEYDKASAPPPPPIVVSTAPPPPPPPQPVSARPPEPKKDPPAAGTRRVYGVVYDMDSRLPVGRARVIFTGPKKAYDVRADRDGFYQVDLLGACAKGVEYTVETEAEGYREGQIEDVDPPYFSRTPEERRTALDQLTPSDTVPFSLRCPDRGSIALDVVLVREP